MIQQMITFLNKKWCFVILLFLLIGCSVKESKENSDNELNESEVQEFSTLELEYFTLNGLKLVERRESLIEKFGTPSKEAKHVHLGDTLHTIYYNLKGVEIAFEQKSDTVFFSYLEFSDISEFKFKNEYASFSKETKLDPFKLLFNDSVKNAQSHGGRTIVTVKAIGRDKSWISFEFEKGRLKKINFDTPY